MNFKVNLRLIQIRFLSDYSIQIDSTSIVIKSTHFTFYFIFHKIV